MAAALARMLSEISCQPRDILDQIVQHTTYRQSHGWFGSTSRFLEGVVRYSDALVLYEDFADAWRCPAAAQTTLNQPSDWEYPQRVDVREWEHVVPDGVQVDGLSIAGLFAAIRRAVFEIPEAFFEAIAAEFRNAT